MNGKVEGNLLYLCLHRKLLLRADKLRCISKKEFYKTVGVELHVPKKFRVLILKEMERKNLLKVLGERASHIRITEPDVDIDASYNKIAHHLGLY